MSTAPKVPDMTILSGILCCVVIAGVHSACLRPAFVSSLHRLLALRLDVSQIRQPLSSRSHERFRPLLPTQYLIPKQAQISRIGDRGLRRTNTKAQTYTVWSPCGSKAVGSIYHPAPPQSSPTQQPSSQQASEKERQHEKGCKCNIARSPMSQPASPVASSPVNPTSFRRATLNARKDWKVGRAGVGCYWRCARLPKVGRTPACPHGVVHFRVQR
jgi:hypothetical protein